MPAVYTGDIDVLKSPAADDWLCLLEAIDQPHRPGMVRAAAATMFFRNTADDLARGGSELTDEVAETLRQWADHAREAGVPAIFEAAQLAGMGRTCCPGPAGSGMTDLAHVTQLLHETAQREHYSLPALRDWLRTQREEGSQANERSRRLDSEAEAVQVMTVWGSKGLQFPIVYLPYAFNRHLRRKTSSGTTTVANGVCTSAASRASWRQPSTRATGRRAERNFASLLRRPHPGAVPDRGLVGTLLG